MSEEPGPGLCRPELSLRESKKRAARAALSWAALRLATERGLENLRVEDIAAEVGVSPRTFNNYFSSKEEAICAFNIERQERLRDALLARPIDEPLWTAIVNAAADQYLASAGPTREYVDKSRLLIMHPTLLGEFLKAHAEMERILAEAIMLRVGLDRDDPADAMDVLHAHQMAGMVGVATRIAVHHWLTSDADDSFVPMLQKLLREIAAGLPGLTTRSGKPVGGLDQVGPRLS